MLALMPRPNILLTGFGPFPDVPENATQRLVPLIAKAARKRFPTYRVVSEILPTEWAAGPQRLATLMAKRRPVVALHFGVSREARGFVIEAKGRNACRPAPDAAGLLPAARLLARGGPPEYTVSLPVAAIIARLQSLGLHASRSDDAGGYLCNAVLYHALASMRPDAVTGFVHVPSSLSDEEPQPLSWADAERGALEVLTLAVDHARARREARQLPA